MSDEIPISITEVDEGDSAERRGMPVLRFVKYEDYGPDRWPVRSSYVTASNIGEAFIAVRNPLDRTCVVLVNLGINAAESVALERLRPKPDQLDEATIRERLSRMQPLRPEYVRVQLTFAPGATLRIPREWLRGLRVIREGVVSSGLMPFCEVVGADNPPLHPALYTSPEPLPAPQRRKGARV